ncbi:MAG: hypothetical protein N2043_01895 [Ignavibacterium sp.]|nr:hypothetical protein [Ignavibacterium sp.]
MSDTQTNTQTIQTTENPAPPYPLIELSLSGGTSEKAKIKFIGRELQPGIEFSSLFHRTAKNEKQSTFNVVVWVPISSENKVKIVVPLIGRGIDTKMIDYLFGPNAFEEAFSHYPESYPDILNERLRQIGAPTEQNEEPLNQNPQDPVPDDEYSSPSEQRNLSIEPYQFYLNNVNTVYNSHFDLEDQQVVSTSGNMAHNPDNGSYVSMGTGQLYAQVFVPENQDFYVYFTFEDTPTDSVIYLDNSSYGIKLYQVTEDAQQKFIVSIIDAQTGQVIDSDETQHGNEVIIFKHGQNMIIDVHSEGQTNQLFYRNIFTNSELTQVIWKSNEQSGVRQALTFLGVYTCDISV